MKTEDKIKDIEVLLEDMKDSKVQSVESYIFIGTAIIDDGNNLKASTHVSGSIINLAQVIGLTMNVDETFRISVLLAVQEYIETAAPQIGVLTRPILAWEVDNNLCDCPDCIAYRNNNKGVNPNHN